MPICENRKIVFIHIPKTAGTVINKLLDLRHKEKLFQTKYGVYNFNGIKYSPQHLTPDLVIYLRPECKNYFKFCLTRHPYNKVVSEYFWLKRDYDKRPVRFFMEYRFRNWIKNTMSLKDIDHKLDQIKYVKGCDMVYKQEDFLANPKPLLKTLGIDENIKLPKGHINKKGTSEIAQNLSFKTKKIIQDFYPNDFEELGYER